MALASEGGNELVHDAAGDSGEFMLGLLREKSLLDGINLFCGRGFNQRGGADFKRGAAAQSAAKRHGGHEGDIQGGNLHAVILESGEHSPDVVGPFGRALDHGH